MRELTARELCVVERDTGVPDAFAHALLLHWIKTDLERIAEYARNVLEDQEGDVSAHAVAPLIQ